MSELAAIIPCICGAISIIEEIIDVRAKIKVGDQSAIDDLLTLMKNYDKHTKKEKQLIRKTLEHFLEMIKTPSNSAIVLTINNDNSSIQETKDC